MRNKLPVIGKGADCIPIVIPPFLDQEVRNRLEQEAAAAVLAGKRIVWELAFGWGEKPLFIDDPSLFFSFGLWIEEFIQVLYAKFPEDTFGIILFRGSSDFTSYFIQTERHEELCRERAGEFPLLPKEWVEYFFAADLVAEYLQRLGSFIPDTVPLLYLIDMSSERDLAKSCYLLVNDRFNSPIRALKGCRLSEGEYVWEDPVLIPRTGEGTLGICLPALQKMDPERMNFLSRLIENLLQKKISFKLLPEERINEGWDGIDDLIVFSSLTGMLGIRQLRGFSASGGRIIYEGKSLETEREISLENYLLTET